VLLETGAAIEIGSNCSWSPAAAAGHEVAQL